MSVGLQMLVVLFALAVLLVPITVALVVMAFRATKRNEQTKV